MNGGRAIVLGTWVVCACASGANSANNGLNARRAEGTVAKPEFSTVEPTAEAQQSIPAGMRTLVDEIERAMTALRSRGPLAPYFIGQQLTEYDVVSISATDGALTGSSRNRVRMLMTDVRVGKHGLDSTHPVDGSFEGGAVTVAPLDPNAHEALSRVSWQQIDGEYQRASERFLALQSQANVRVDIEDRSGDFSQETPVQHIGTPAPSLEVTDGEWETRVRALSARLRDQPGIFGGEAKFEANSGTRWIVNSEGTKIQTGERLYRVIVSGHTRAEDGMDLSRTEQFAASTLSRLPTQEQLGLAVDKVALELAQLRTAKPAEPFVGPAILSGRAAAVFFHETFGHRVEGERQKLEGEGQTFAKKIGERVMPSFLNVYDDPRLLRLGSTELGGFYRFDDEGVPAQRATLVEAGVLKGFLLSRVPVRGIVKSNGHGRRFNGAAMARQANLVVEPSQGFKPVELRQRLIAEVKRQNKTYGLLFSEIEGGYTETGRETMQGYKLLPVMVYRVFSDGRPDELIRGVDIVGTPLVSLSKVLAAGDDYSVFNGSCGAESGWVPVSAVSPSLLVQQIEVALRDKGNEKPPVLPPPAVAEVVR